MEYPVLEIIPQLKAVLQEKTIAILQAPPGAGKSTILPLRLLNEPWLEGKKIVMLEPRRLAARSVAARMASLLNEEVGKTVGYRIRFENCTSDATRIEVVTEGILTRMIQRDITLEGVGIILFDEFHERSLQADLALALSYQVQQTLRDDLRLLIMSATLEGNSLSAIFNNAPAIESSGRQYPVDVKYQQPEDESLSRAMTRLIRKVLKEQTGDMLVFLPGTGDIMRVQNDLEENSEAFVVPLYGDLPFKKQQEAILPHPEGRRKIVLATSIAETSLTIEGITTVVDSGYARVPRYDVRTGLTRLETVRVTLDSANQRAGRAGRLGPGVCYRLWNERSHHQLQAVRKPEILEADLASLVLELSAWGVQKIEELKWITPPPKGALLQATELLEQLGALNEGIITARGRAMVQLPTHPRLAHMLLEAQEDNLVALACDVAAVMEERDPFQKESGADLSLRIEALRKWRAGEKVFADKNVLERSERLSAAWRRNFKIKEENKMPSGHTVGLLVAAAYPDRIAKQLDKNGNRYKLPNGKLVTLAQQDDLVREPWLSIAQLDAGQKEGKIFLAAAVDENELDHLALEREVVRWDKEREMVVGAQEKSVGSLILASKPLTKISDEKRIKVLIDVIRNEGLKILGWGETEEKWQARVLSLRAWRKEEEWPDVSEEHLLTTLEEWLSPYLNNVSKRSDFKKLELPNILTGLLPWNLQSKLDELAPAKIEVPSDSMIAVQYYPDGRQPELAVRLQEVFGLLETPTVNDGKTKMVMHLLSPGYKPVQVTQDLKSFWGNAYTEVRKELRARYPKHSWPEDPWTAKAVRGVKKRT
ncbi:MAG TPA: ATP-dependent helicase HrpB [Cyclobacteriaceae bacterium]|nr:ATP-dependent helicase HrpB [Cyclobacteriaceae bacterium]